MFERQVSVRHGRFMERGGVLPSAKFAFRKSQGTLLWFTLCASYTLQSKVRVPCCDLLCARPIHCRVHLRVGRRLGSCRLISMQPLIGSTISAFTISSALWVFEVQCRLYWQFLSNRSQHVMVDGCRSKLVIVVSWVPRGCVLGPWLLLVLP